MDWKDLLNLLKSKNFQLIACVAILGIIISLSLFFDNLKNDRFERNVNILKELAEIDKNQITDPNLLAIYDQMIIDFRNSSLYETSVMSNLSFAFKPAKNKSGIEFIFKFLSGGILLMIMCIMMLLAKYKYAIDNGLRFRNISLTDIYIYIGAWLIPSLINMLIPLFENRYINYLFFPSCLTLLFIILANIYLESMEKYERKVE
jgi:hypothetical protein